MNIVNFQIGNESDFRWVPYAEGVWAHGELFVKVDGTTYKVFYYLQGCGFYCDYLIPRDLPANWNPTWLPDNHWQPGKQRLAA